MNIDREWMQAHIPHQGSMCLLERALSWDLQQIHCRADSHRDAANPLRNQGELSAVCAIEYAAQAMAVHGALVTANEPSPESPPESTNVSNKVAQRPRVGFLASARGVNLHVARLDDQISPLDIFVRRISGDARSILYEFSVRAADRVLVDGRAAVITDPVAVQTAEVRP